MGSWLRGRALAARAVCFPLLILGSGDDPMGRDDTTPCIPTTAPALLSSKLDDDDGDGNPHDENYPTVDDEDDAIVDHAWIQHAIGVHHLFVQNEDRGVGSDIEHYTTDLQNLTYVGVALQKSPGSWDSQALWAPYIVQSGSAYLMFYTGTSGTGPDAKQRIGLAVSMDLATWTRLPVNLCPETTGDGCIYECAESWTTWGGQPGAHNQQCRDPFVLWDAAHHRWVLFATAKSTSGSGVITVAYSSDLVHWRGAGYIDATRLLAGGTGGQTTGGQAENPYVLSHGGTFYLLFSDWADPEDDCTVPHPRTIVQYVTSSALLADAAGSSHWSYRGFIPDPGVNALEALVVDGDTWILSQSITDRTSCDYEGHRRELRLKRIVWGPKATFATAPWAPCASTP